MMINRSGCCGWQPEIGGPGLGACGGQASEPARPDIGIAAYSFVSRISRRTIERYF